MGNVTISRTVTFSRKGPKGDRGDDGKTLYTWVKYADSVGSSGYPTSAYDDPTGGTKYIGMAWNKDTPIESSDYSLYKWTKFKGEDGTSVSIDGTVDEWRPTTSGYDNATSGKWAVDNPFCIYYWDGTKNVSASVSDGEMYVVSTDNESSDKKGHLIIADGGKWKDLGSIQGPQGPQGPQGQSAKVVVVNADSSVFVYSDNFSTLIGPQSISITATLQGTTGYQWSYKRPSMSSFSSIPGANSHNFGLSSSATLFGSDKSVTVRCTSGGVYDEVTIAKVSSGSDGEDGADGQNGTNGKDAYTVLLSNESHVFEGDSDSAIASSTESEVIAYKGATRISSNIGTITGIPNGMSIQRYSSPLSFLALVALVSL